MNVMDIQTCLPVSSLIQYFLVLVLADFFFQSSSLARACKAFKAELKISNQLLRYDLPGFAAIHILAFVEQSAAEVIERKCNQCYCFLVFASGFSFHL